MKNNPLRILCISPQFVPFHDSEAFCGGKIVKALIEYGLDVVVITMEPHKKSCVYDDSLMWNSLKECTVKLSTHSERNARQSVFYGLKYHTYSWARWVAYAVEYAKSLHRITPFDIVYSRSIPSIAHVAAYWIKKKIKIPWLANINDPWDLHLFPETDFCSSQTEIFFSNHWLRRTLRNADLVTYPSSRLRDFHTRITGIRHNSEIIPHIGLNTKEKHNGSQFNLIHTGKLGMKEITGRSAEGLLKGLKHFLENNRKAGIGIKLVLIGHIEKGTQSLIAELGLNSVVTIIGRVNYENSLQYISSASVCILVEAKMKEGIYFPSKLVDYFAAKKPVIALSPEIGVVADMLPNKGIVRVNVDDPVAISDAIGYFYNAFNNGTLQALSPADDFTKNFESQHIAEKLVQSISRMLHK